MTVAPKQWLQARLASVLPSTPPVKEQPAHDCRCCMSPEHFHTLPWKHGHRIRLHSGGRSAAQGAGRWLGPPEAPLGHLVALQVSLRTLLVHQNHAALLEVISYFVR